MTDGIIEYTAEVADRHRLAEVRAEILRRVGAKREDLEEFFGQVIRQAIDEVLSLGAKRFSIEQLDSVEKTYIGTRVEMLVRDGLDVGRGIRADATIAGHEVDIKWSKSSDWMIGPENVGTVCLGIGLNNRNAALFSAGLFVPTESSLRKGRNRDAKLSLISEFRRTGVSWLIQDGAVPGNFIEQLPPHIREEILAQPSAQARLRKLAERVPNTPIPRSAIVFVSLNKVDPLRRVRADSALSEPPLGAYICLSERFGKAQLSRIGVTLPKNYFYFIRKEDLLT